MKYQVCCMSSDGEIQIERPLFDTLGAAWEYSGDLGSKWYFYPFHFVVTETHKTIVDAPWGLEWARKKRLRTIQHRFLVISKIPEAHAVDADSFLNLLLEAYG